MICQFYKSQEGFIFIYSYIQLREPTSNVIQYKINLYSYKKITKIPSEIKILDILFSRKPRVAGFGEYQFYQPFAYIFINTFYSIIPGPTNYTSFPASYILIYTLVIQPFLRIYF